MFNVSTFLTDISNRIGSNPHWSHWPFGPGFGDTWSAVARLVFVALILGFIILFLKILFGPKGIFRDHEMDREAAEMKKEALERLDEEFKEGKMSELEYKYKKREIEC